MVVCLELYPTRMNLCAGQMAMSNFRYYAPAKSKFNNDTLGSKVNISVLAADNLSYAVMLHLGHSAIIDLLWMLRNCSY